MIKPLKARFLKIRASARATAWWLTDSLAAVPVAAGIALAVGTRLASGTSLWWPALLLAVGGIARALSVWRAQMSGQAAASATAATMRARLHPVLLPSRLIRGRLIGEDLHLAVDSIAGTEGQVARFLPLRRASSLSPLLIAIAVAPASWLSSLILTATLVPFILAMALAGGAAAKRADTQHVALSRLTGLFVDRLRALPTILSFSAEHRIARHLGEAATDVARRTMAVLAIAFASSAICPSSEHLAQRAA